MKVLVDLNSQVESFQIKEVHKERLVNEFDSHDFEFVGSYKEFKTKVHGAEAALVWLFPEHLFPKAGNLSALYTPAAGKDWVAEDLSGKVKTYFSRFHGEIIAESFLSMVLYFNNQLKVAVDNQRSKIWDRNAFKGRSLCKNQSLLIIGYGSIGEKCAKAAKSLGMEVTGISRSKSSDNEVSIIRPENISESIGSFDHILNLLPGGNETYQFVNSDLINSMQSSACFYNFGRGTTVDESALVEALETGKVAYAGLDVMEIEPLPSDSPLWELKNVLLTPHSSCCYDDYLHLFIDELHGKL